MPTLLGELDQRSSEIRFEAIDFSSGELIRLHQYGEILIQPAFQRMFRWSQAQQSRLIVSDWLDEYSEAVVKTTIPFDYTAEWTLFDKVFTVVGEKLGSEAFVKHKNNRALGGLAPAYFDAVTMGLLPLVDRIKQGHTPRR